MPVPDLVPGAPCWIDLFTSDPDASRAFYGELFGWTSEEAGEEYGGYVNFSKDGHKVAGCMRNDGASGVPDAWSVYLRVADAEVTVKEAAERDCMVPVPPMPVGTLGVMGAVVDPGGAFIGLWQPGEHRGFEVVDEPGTPGWFELHTRDYDLTVAFYREVFGWDLHTAADTPEFRYATLGEGESQRAGIMDATNFLPDGVPAHWSVYFRVADTDETLARAEALGATVVMPAQDSPYGRLASLVDVTGALFKLLG